MTDLVVESIISRLFQDATIAQKTQGRIWKQHVSMVKEVQFPVITLLRRTVGVADPAVPLYDFELLVSCFATSPQEAWELYEALRAALDHYSATVSGRTFVLGQAFPPMETVETDVQPIYQVATLYQVRQLS